MRRLAYLFGNTNGLVGVQKDLIEVRNFLMSNIGGNWYEKEICLKYNMSLADLNSDLNKLRKSNLDYLILYFSGHGDAERRDSFIILNKFKEFIDVKDLEKIATRQLNIYDCCRAFDHSPEKSMESNFSLFEDTDLTSIRSQYENRIMQASPQQMNLYSCALGECSIDDDGGVYTKNLLHHAQVFHERENLVSDVHKSAAFDTCVDSNMEQNPCCKMLKLPPEKQLIISINPTAFILNEGGYW